jgi:hypothetical protein
MRRNRWLRGLKFGLLALLALAVVGAVTMALWNGLMPALFGWPAIGFWQALGLLVLGRLLLGGFRGGPGRHLYWRSRMHERWAQMTDEEREAFREGMRRRCGHERAAPPPAA